MPTILGLITQNVTPIKVEETLILLTAEEEAEETTNNAPIAANSTTLSNLASSNMDSL